MSQARLIFSLIAALTLLSCSTTATKGEIESVFFPAALQMAQESYPVGSTWYADAYSYPLKPDEKVVIRGHRVDPQISNYVDSGMIRVFIDVEGQKTKHFVQEEYYYELKSDWKRNPKIRIAKRPLGGVIRGLSPNKPIVKKQEKDNSMDLILKFRQVRIGMSEEEMISAMGQPRRLHSYKNAAGTRKQYVYWGGYVYVEDGIVTGIGH